MPKIIDVDGDEVSLPKGWLISKKGNPYKKIKNKFLTIFKSPKGGYSYVYDDDFCIYGWRTKIEAVMFAEEDIK